MAVYEFPRGELFLSPHSGGLYDTTSDDEQVRQEICPHALLPSTISMTPAQVGKELRRLPVKDAVSPLACDMTEGLRYV